MLSLKGKRILLLAPFFYGYENEIVKSLREKGAKVSYFNNHPDKKYETIVGVSKKIGLGYYWLIEHFGEKVYSKIYREKYDIILVINGKAITPNITHLLRTNNLGDDGKMVLYYWDCIAQVGDDISRWKDFDNIYTFDNVDYETHKDRMKFLPLFYCEKYWQKQEDRNVFDTMLVGSFSIHRLNFIKQVKKNNPDLKIGSYLYVPKWQITFHKLLRPKYKFVRYSDLKFKKLSFVGVIEQYMLGRAVIDIPMPGQNGLTIRTIEALAMHKKIITTNKNILGYDFYNGNDIFVIDTEHFKLPTNEWFKNSFMIPDGIIHNYSLERWIETLIL